MSKSLKKYFISPTNTRCPKREKTSNKYKIVRALHHLNRTTLEPRQIKIHFGALKTVFYILLLEIHAMN